MSNNTEPNDAYNNFLLNNVPFIEQLIFNTQITLIEQISKDYNISIRELKRQYIVKPKKTQKILPPLARAPPTKGKKIINTELINDNLISGTLNDNTQIEIKIFENKDNVEDNVGENVEENVKDNVKENEKDNVEVLFKSVMIKKTEYLLNIQTNEIYDMENILVGKKQNGKYLIKKNL